MSKLKDKRISTYVLFPTDNDTFYRQVASIIDQTDNGEVISIGYIENYHFAASSGHIYPVFGMTMIIKVRRTRR